MLRNLKEALADFRAALQKGESRPEPPPINEPAIEPIALVPPMPPVSAEAQSLDTAIAQSDTTPHVPENAADSGSLDSASEPDGQSAVQGPAPPEQDDIIVAAPVRVAWWRRRAVALTVTGLLVLWIVIPHITLWRQAMPADPQVVATYEGGTVTRDQLKQHFETLPPAEQQFYRSPQALTALVGQLAIEEVTRRWATEKQVDQQEVFKEAMKHATENIQIADISGQLHEGRIPVGEGELQTYYDQNREQFGDRPLTEVKDQIRQTLVEQKEQDYIAGYLKDLRERASLQVDYSLLAVPEPAEQELTGYYQTNREQFRVPEQAQIAQIAFSIDSAGSEEQARTQAETARARAAAGEDFTTLAQQLSDGPEQAQAGAVADPVSRGSRSPAFDEAVFTLKDGELSPVFKEGDDYVVVKLLTRIPERQPSFEEVRDEILNIVRTQREQQVYDERKDRTLFTIHSRRTTLGEFLKELDELPPDVRAQAIGLDGKRKVLERLIDRLLVVEDASEQASEIKGEDEIEQARTVLLSQLLHQEDVDEKITITDDEVRAAYDADPVRYGEPARVQVNYIRVSRGLAPDEDAAARARIEEAAAKLKPGGFFGRGAPAADFATVAKEYSEDAETAVKGGQLDRWFGESGDQVSEIFEHVLHEQLLALDLGEVSPVVPLDDSYYLFQIRTKQEARTRPFEEVQELIRQDLEARKHDELTRATERAFIERMQLQIYDPRIVSVLDELGGPVSDRLPEPPEPDQE